VTRHRLIVAQVAVFAMLACGIAGAQQPPAPSSQQPAATKEPVLLKVQVVISRRQGDKVISRHPYILNVDADGTRSNLKMGTQVPVTSTGGDGKTFYNYQSVGTDINCSAKTLDGGRYKLDIGLTDNQVLADDASGTAKGLPQFGSLSLSNEYAVLRDGQTTQLTTATEKSTGTVITVDVTLNVIK
jgi:hypothetical protein